MVLFVWDFHGVLEKDNEKAVIDISNQVLARSGFQERFTHEDNERYYGLKWYQYFERLLPGLTHEDHIALQSECFRYAEDNLDILTRHIKPNDYVLEVLSEIAQTGNIQLVISNTRQADLIWFLDSIGVKGYFDKDHIIGVNAHQTHNTKVDAITKFIEDLNPEKVIVIGDSEDDLIMGKAVGATTYFYKHPHREHENTNNADHVIKDLRVILKEL